ncbi:MAG: S41 family peptidase [Steroidobacteraceae bacterium]
MREVARSRIARRRGRHLRAAALLCAMVLVLPNLAHGAPIDLQPVSAAVARRQLVALAQVLERYHPALRAPQAHARFAAELRRLESSAHGPLPAWRSWLLQQELVRTLDDPHTAVYPILLERRILPVTVRWVADGILISPAGGSSSPPFPADSELLGLGRYDPGALLARLRQIFPGTDNFIEHFKHLPGYELYWLGVVDVGGRVELTVRTPAGAVRHVTLGLVTQPKDWLTHEMRSSDRSWYQWRLDRAADVGWFTLDSMRITPAYEQSVTDFFQATERAGITRAVVDLRRNGGGSSFADVPFLLQMGVKRYRDYEQVELLDPSSMHQRLEHLERVLKVRFPQVYVAHVPVPSAPPPGRTFRGKLYIATGPGCFSSAMDFAADVKYNHVGTIIGEPCAETVTGPGEVIDFMKNPPSGIPMQVSTKTFRWPGLPNGALVQPDIAVPLTVSDVRQGIDPVRAWFHATRGGVSRSRE